MSPKDVRKPSKTILAVLATTVRAHREGKGLSQEAFADLCGLHRTYVGSVERSERNVTLSTLEALGGALGLSLPELLTPPAREKRRVR